MAPNDRFWRLAFGVELGRDFVRFTFGKMGDRIIALDRQLPK
jgi:hypothetical protein